MGIQTTQVEIEVGQLLMQSTFALPSSLYIGLYSVDGTDSTSGVELTGSGYTRISTTGWDWNSTSRYYSNSSVVTFPTATGAWSTVKSFGVFDSDTSGQLLRFGALDTDRKAESGDTLRFSTNAIKIQINPSTDI